MKPWYVLIVALAGCPVDATPPEGVLVCAAAGDCPRGWVCAGGLCSRAGGDDASRRDAGPPDAAPPDAVVDAGRSCPACAVDEYCDSSAGACVACDADGDGAPVRRAGCGPGPYDCDDEDATRHPLAIVRCGDGSRLGCSDLADATGRAEAGGLGVGVVWTRDDVGPALRAPLSVATADPAAGVIAFTDVAQTARLIPVSIEDMSAGPPLPLADTSARSIDVSSIDGDLYLAMDVREGAGNDLVTGRVDLGAADVTDRRPITTGSTGLFPHLSVGGGGGRPVVLLTRELDAARRHVLRARQLTDASVIGTYEVGTMVRQETLATDGSEIFALRTGIPGRAVAAWDGGDAFVSLETLSGYTGSLSIARAGDGRYVLAFVDGDGHPLARELVCQPGGAEGCGDALAAMEAHTLDVSASHVALARFAGRVAMVTLEPDAGDTFAVVRVAGDPASLAGAEPWPVRVDLGEGETVEALAVSATESADADAVLLVAIGTARRVVITGARACQTP